VAVDAVRTRVHGDFHLGQVLWSEGDFYILDFEGEPARSLDERRRKASPLKDVAGMLRSFSYAAYAGLFIRAAGRPDEVERLEPWARTWSRWAGAAFLKGYLAVAGDAPLALLDLFLIEKALYELNYELNNRPDWVRIPLRGLSELVSGT
jgi:maltose alpha-D-glucosyltransferase/alpha-amylase